MPVNIPEGERMIDVFATVGAREFVVTKLDLNQELIWAKNYSAKELREKLPAMMRTAEPRKPIRFAAPKRSALAPCAPFRNRTCVATGGSGGNAIRPEWPRTPLLS